MYLLFLTFISSPEIKLGLSRNKIYIYKELRREPCSFQGHQPTQTSMVQTLKAVSPSPSFDQIGPSLLFQARPQLQQGIEEISRTLTGLEPEQNSP